MTMENRLFEHLEEMVTMDMYDDGEVVIITTYYEGDERSVCLSYSEAKTLCKALNKIAWKFEDEE